MSRKVGKPGELLPTAHACVSRNWIRRRDYSLIFCDVSCAFDIPCFLTSNFPAPRVSSSFLAVRVVSSFLIVAKTLSSMLLLLLVNAPKSINLDLYLLLGFRLVNVRFQITNCRVLPQLLPAVESPAVCTWQEVLEQQSAPHRNLVGLPCNTKLTLANIHHGYVVVIISQGSELVPQLLPLDRSARKPQCCSDVLLLGVVTSHVTRQFRSQFSTVTACLFLSSTGRVCQLQLYDIYIYR